MRKQGVDIALVVFLVNITIDETKKVGR